MFNLYKSWLESRKDSITGEQSKDGKPYPPSKMISFDGSEKDLERYRKLTDKEQLELDHGDDDDDWEDDETCPTCGSPTTEPKRHRNPIGRHD